MRTYMYVYKYWKHQLVTEIFEHILETPTVNQYVCMYICISRYSYAHTYPCVKTF